MWGKGIRLFSLFGFEVRIDTSWLLLAVLITFSLTRGYFPLRYQELGGGWHLVMGITGAIGLFASIVLHEMCHSLVARRYGIPLKGITLFMFGGVAQMSEEPKSPKAEAMMAGAGPLASFVLAGGFYALETGSRLAAAPLAVTGVLGYLAWINLILAFFNLLPAFPLDGGRLLRSALWAWKRNLHWATRIASGIGSGFGDVLLILGILALFAGQFVGGLWWCLIGMFLRGISQGSYRQVVVHDALAGEPVRRLMRDNPIIVPSTLTVAALVHDFIYHHHFKMFPVVDSGRLVGCVTTREVKAVQREDWPSKTVADIASGCSEQNTIKPEADAMDVLTTMSKTGNSRLMVAEGSRLLGIVAMKDLMNFLALKMDLEGDKGDRQKLGVDVDE